MHKHLWALSDVFGCDHKNFVPYCYKFRVAQLPDVGVEESTNKSSERTIPSCTDQSASSHSKKHKLRSPWCAYPVPAKLVRFESYLTELNAIEIEKIKANELRRTTSASRSASENEIRRPPYLKRIWPFNADSWIKTPFPALRMVDLRISHAANQWSSLVLNFLGRFTGNRGIRNDFQ